MGAIVRDAVLGLRRYAMQETLGPVLLIPDAPYYRWADGICRGAASRSSSLIRMARLPQR